MITRVLVFSYLLKLDSCQPAVDCSTGQGLPVHCLVSLLVEMYLQLQREECIQSGALLPCVQWVVITSEGSCVVVLTSGRIMSDSQLWWLMILLEVNGWSSTVLIPEECGLFNGDFRASCVACRCGTVPIAVPAHGLLGGAQLPPSAYGTVYLWLPSPLPTLLLSKGD